MTLPDRFADLIQRLEAAQSVHLVDLQRLSELQAFDLAKIGEDFARDYMRRETEHTEHMRQILEALGQ